LIFIKETVIPKRYPLSQRVNFLSTHELATGANVKLQKIEQYFNCYPEIENKITAYAHSTKKMNELSRQMAAIWLRRETFRNKRRDETQRKTANVSTAIDTH